MTAKNTENTETKKKHNWKYDLILLAVLAVIIAVSRVVTGVHFVSDVLAGLAFGLVFAVAGRVVYIAAASALGFYAIMVI